MGSSSSDRRPWEKPRAFAAREGITPRLLRQWVDKGIVERRALAPRVAVRVRYRDER
jgi:hypothetical protein